MKRLQKYNAHETERLKQVHGAPLASFSTRLVAFGIDFIIAFIFFIVSLFCAGWLGLLDRLGVTKDANLEFGLGNWYSLVFIVIYFCLSTYWGNGKTLGKKLMGIRVISLVHNHMSLWHSFERALGYGASALEGGFGFIQYFIHPNRRTVHDRIAETIVIRDKETTGKSS